MPVSALCLCVSCLPLPGAAAEDARPKPLATFSIKPEGEPRADVQWAAFTPAGSLAVRYAAPKANRVTLGVFDVATGKPVAAAVVKGGDAWDRRVSCAVAPDGAWVAYAEAGGLRFLPLPPGKPALPGDGFLEIKHVRADTGVWLDGRGEVAFLYSDSEFEVELREWNLAKGTGRQLFRTGEYAYGIGTHALDPRTRQLAVASKPDGEEARIDNWSLAEKPSKVTIPTKWRARSLAHSPDGKVLAAGFEDGSVAWYDAATGKTVRQLPRIGRLTVWSVAFHPGGKHLAYGTFDRGAPNLFLIDAASGEVAAKLDVDANGVTAVCFSPTGGRLAVFGATGTVTVWDAAALLKLRRD